MNELTPLEPARLSCESSRTKLSRKDILEFVRSMYPGEVGPEDVLEAAYLIDAWQTGKITFRLEPVFDKDQEETVAFGLSNLRVLVGLPKDDPASDEAKEDDGSCVPWRSQLEKKSATIEHLEGKVSDLQSDLSIKIDNERLIVRDLHEATRALDCIKKALTKRTVMAVFFAGLSVLEGLSFLAWAFL